MRLSLLLAGGLILSCEPVGPVPATETEASAPEPSAPAASPAAAANGAAPQAPARPLLAEHPPWEAPTPEALPDAARLPTGDYAALVAAIEADRQRLAGFDAREAARTYLRDAITLHIVPAWAGTRWAFYGAAQAPGQGEIACGYWVASVLRDAGFRVSRDQLGKQASERILLTFAEPTRLRHYGREVVRAVSDVRAAGVGLWGVGLANHTGFLWNDGDQVRFCHSNYNGTRGPECEDADSSWALVTSYTVIAPVLDDATLDAWLEGRTLVTGRFGS